MPLLRGTSALGLSQKKPCPASVSWKDPPRSRSWHGIETICLFCTCSWLPQLSVELPPWKAPPLLSSQEGGVFSSSKERAWSECWHPKPCSRLLSSKQSLLCNFTSLILFQNPALSLQLLRSLCPHLAQAATFASKLLQNYGINPGANTHPIKWSIILWGTHQEAVCVACCQG